MSEDMHVHGVNRNEAEAELCPLCGCEIVEGVHVGLRDYLMIALIGVALLHDITKEGESSALVTEEDWLEEIRASEVIKVDY